MPTVLGQSKRKMKGVVDVVFCVDATGSMSGCFENLKKNIGTFVTELEKAIEVKADGEQAEITVKDWRVRLLPFGDLTCDGSGAMVESNDFVSTAGEFQSVLAATKLVSGGDEPESALDAVYRAAKNSSWRDKKTARRFIVLFTDATAKPLHDSTTGGGPGDVSEVVQELKLAGASIVVYALKTDDYQKLIDANAQDVVRDASKLFPSYKDAHAFFDSTGAEFKTLMATLAKSISVGSCTTM